MLLKGNIDNNVTCEIKTQEELIDYCENKSDFYKIYNLFVDYYGEENVDIQYISAERIAEIDNNSYYNDDYYYKHIVLFDIIVYFSTITLTNENSESYTITDLYVKIPVRYNYTCSAIYLTRSSLTYDEYMSGYIHSHVSRNPYYRGSIWSALCLGTGPFQEMVYNLNANINSWELVCFNLQEALGVESLEGVPYARFSSIHEYIPSSYANCYKIGIPSEYISEDALFYIINNYDFKFNVVNNTVSIAEYITDFAIKISNIYSDYCDKKHIEPHLKSYIIGANGLPSEISNSSPILDNNTIDIDVLTFKGQNIKLRLSNLNIVTTYNLLSYEDICYIAFTVCNALNIILSSDENDLPETKSFNSLYTSC